MTKTIEDLFVYLAIYTALIPVLIFLSALKKFEPEKKIRIIVLYSTIEFLINIIVDNLSSAKINSLLYCLFTILEYLLFTFFLYSIIKNSKFKKVMLFLSAAFLVFACIYFLFIKTRPLDSVPIGIETILILSYSFYYLYEQLEIDSELFIYNRYPFWIVSAFMIYLAGSFFIYIFANQVDKKTLHEYWAFTNVFTTLKNLIFTAGFLIFLKSSRTPIKKNPYLYSN